MISESVTFPLLTAALALLATAASALGQHPTTAPCNPKSTPATVALYHWLQTLPSRPDHRLMLGQNLGHGESCPQGYRDWVDAITRKTSGQLTPAVVGVDYGWDQITPEGVARANAILIQHWKQGGLVTISLHPGNPFVDHGTVHQRTNDDLRQLLDPTTPAGHRWFQTLKTTADGLDQLQQAGVVVLFRPFHENNGGWFWWSHGQRTGNTWTRREEFTALWRDMFDYFTRERGLNNLLWVFAPNATGSESLQPTDHYYPGADLVDVVGMDIYADTITAPVLNADNGYDRLIRLNKPFAITEIGPSTRNGAFDGLAVVEGIKKDAPAAIFALWWHSWGTALGRAPMAIIDNPNWDQALAHPWVATLPQSATRPGR